MNLLIPVRDVLITQYFGNNFLFYDETSGKVINLYPSLGYNGHPGIDWRGKVGCKWNIMHSGIVMVSGASSTGSLNLVVNSIKVGKGIRTKYSHCSKLHFRVGDKVRAGDVGGLIGKSGKYQTGPHLHTDLCDIENGKILNYNNGYKGCIDQAPYFRKDWDKSNAYHRYGRRQEWLAEFNTRFKNKWLHRQLIKRGQLNKVYDIEFVNAIVYGGWDFETVINPGMENLWKYLKKTEFEKGMKPFA